MENVESTIISQYSESATIVQIIKGMNEWIDPSADIQAFYDYVFNVETAQGFGLDYWGKIVGVDRNITITNVNDGPYLGFKEQLIPVPSKVLNFTSGVLDSGITFTRSSSATRINSAGLIESVSVNTPRFDYDPVTLAAKGLLIEDQRTNLLTYSEQFDNAAWVKTNSTVTANAAVSPDGTQDGDKLVENTATGFHEVNEAATLSVGTAYALSCYAKADTRAIVRLAGRVGGSWSILPAGVFDLSAGVVLSSTGDKSATITNVGNGWYRCTIYGTPSATNAGMIIGLMQNESTASYTGDGTSGLYIWGAQLETGSFATSYIPTTTAQATRAADVAVMTGTNFSSWHNQSEGTLFVEGETIADSSASRTFAHIDDGTTENRMMLVRNTGSAVVFNSTATSVSQDLITSVTVASDVFIKAAGAYKASNFAVSAGGSTPVTSATGSVPTVNEMIIGAHPSSALMLNGHIKTIKYWNKRLSNDELKLATA